VLSAASDPDGDLPLAALVLAGNGPTQGTLNLQADGSFTYIPIPGFNGIDGFNFTVRDQRGRFVTRQAQLIMGELSPTNSNLVLPKVTATQGP
jgi:hypothetical protein